MFASDPRPTAPGSGSEFRPWNAHPLAVSTTPHPSATNRVVRLPIMIPVSLRQAVALQAPEAVAILRPATTRPGRVAGAGAGAGTAAGGVPRLGAGSTVGGATTGASGSNGGDAGAGRPSGAS